MAQTAAQIGLTTTTGRRPTTGVVRRGISALAAALRRSDEKRRLASTLGSRDVGRQTGVRC